jgi:hypothetical protein
MKYNFDPDKMHPKSTLYGGVYLKKIPNFFKKSFSMRGVYLIFGGVTNIPPWSDFENLVRFRKSGQIFEI